MPRTIDELYFADGGPPLPPELFTALRGLGELLTTLASYPFPTVELAVHLEWAACKVVEVTALVRHVLGGPSLETPPEHA